MALYLRESGAAQAPTIVFLHGGGVSGWMWQPQIEQLEGDYHLLVPDLPEHGRSAGEIPFTMDGAATCIAELIRARAHGGRAHLVGLSLGGQLILKLLTLAPEVVDRAVVSGALALRIPGLWLMGPSIRLNMPLLRLDWVIRVQRRRAGIPDRYHEQFRAEAQGLTAGTLVRIYREGLGAGLPAGLERVTVPVLVLVGQKEPGLSRRSARDLVAAIPGAQGYLVPGVGHTWNLQAPELFTQVVRAWVEGQRLPAGLYPLS